ncbi:MAG: invasion associated locus B family protein [Methyloligellaceae bacterium]
MEFSTPRMKRLGRWSRALIVPACVLAAATGLGAPASQAQQPQQPAQATAQKPKPAGETENAWVKLCEDKPIITAGGIPSKRTVCLIHHERLSAVNGRVLVSTAIRTISGQDQKFLMVLVPLGVALPPGIQVRIDNEKPIPLKYTFCHIGGCTAETIATKEVIEKFKKGNKIDVLAINNVGKTIGFPIPLKGFTKAYEGKPVDSKKYQAARLKLMKLIQSRQAELAKKARAQQGKAKQGAQPQAKQPPKQLKLQ